MEIIKKYWDKLLFILAAITGVVFFFLRSRPTPSSDLGSKVIDAQKKQLNEEKAALKKHLELVEKKEYSDEEIEKKYNK